MGFSKKNDIPGAISFPDSIFPISYFVISPNYPLKLGKEG